MVIQARQKLVSSSKYDIKCPYSLDAEYITFHNTANDASANNEINYMIGNDKEVSFHFAIDDEEVVQGLPVNRNAWHTGDGAHGDGNRKSIGIEVCYSKSGGEKYEKAEALAIKFIAQLLHERKWGIDRVRTHKSWTEIGVKKGISNYVKNCPHRVLDEGRWQQVLNEIERELKALNEPTKKFYIRTGGYTGDSLVLIQDFLIANKFYYEPKRKDTGSLEFKIGGFIENTDSADKMIKFLGDNNFWFQKEFVK